MYLHIEKLHQIAHKNINSKQIKDFNIKPEPLGWLEESHASPATPSYEGRSVATKASCDALLHMGTGELMTMWNSDLENSLVQPPPSLKAQEPSRRGGRKTVSQKLGEGLSSAILQAWPSHGNHELTASCSHLTGPVNNQHEVLPLLLNTSY